MEPKTKLEEQATKGYSYWAANAAGEAPPPQPKKLSEEELAAQQQQLTHTASGASAWNAAGTWEERPVPLRWVQEQLGELLCALSVSHQGAEVAVVEVTSCSGEAHQWLVRGKKRAGFELAIEFTWRAQLEGTTVTGTAKLPHAAADELDELHLDVKPDSCAAAATTQPAGNAASGAAGGEGEGEVCAAPPPSAQQRGKAQAAASSLLPRLEAALRELLERMRQR